jgi:hypothetical protein
MVVGSYFDNATRDVLPLAELWGGGSTWTIQTAPLPTGAAQGALFGVSCPSTNACMAVGEYQITSTSRELPLAEAWTGSSWAPTAPQPQIPATASDTWLNAVWCFSGTSCTAVGGYNLSPAGRSTLAEEWNGTGWTDLQALNPAGSSTNDLANLSCNPSAAGPPGTPCEVVGHSDSGPLVESWDGMNWTIQTTPSVTNARLSDVSCTAGNACTAVGSYQDPSIGDSGATATLAERWDGANWAMQPTPDATLVEVGGASSVGSSSAILHATVYPDGATVTSCSFEFGPTPSYGSTVPCAQSVGSGTSGVAVSAGVTGLAPNTTYYFNIVAENAAGGVDGEPFTSASFATTPTTSGSGGGGGGGSGGSSPTITGVTPDHGPLDGGTQITLTGSGFAPGDQVCFSPAVDAGGGQCDFNAVLVSPTQLKAVTPSEDYPTGGLGQYYLVIQRQSGLNFITYPSNVVYTFFPPPPPAPPAPNSCDVFSIGPTACWRVGAGAVGSWFTSEISSSFGPARNPDFIVATLTAGAGYGRGPAGAFSAIITCSGDVFVQPSVGYSFIGGGIPLGVPSLKVVNIGAVLAAGYVGTPGNPQGTYTEHQVDGFVGGATADVSVGLINGMAFVISPLAPGPKTGIEYWEGTVGQIAVSGGFSFWLAGPDETASSNQPCPDILTTSTWHTLTSSLAPVGLATSNLTTVVLPCLSTSSCTGTALLSIGGQSAAVVARAPNHPDLLTIARARFRIAPHSFGRVALVLTRTGRRLLALGHGRLVASLTLDETVAGRLSQHWELVTLQEAPVLKAVKENHQAWAETTKPRSHRIVGTVLSFTLNEAARVTLSFDGRATGHSVAAKLVISSRPGRDSFHFNGKVGRGASLPPGRYILSIIAMNSAGQQSRVRQLKFEILSGH